MVTAMLAPVRVRHLAALLVVVAAALSAVFGVTSAGGLTRGLPLERVRDVRLPGRPSRFDYQSIDPAHRRLYIAHLGDSTVDVIDLDSLTVAATVPDIADVHGVLAAPELGRVFASATGTNELVTIDASTNQVIGRTPIGDYPDGIAYDPGDDLVLVSNKNAGSETVVEGSSGQVVRTVQLGREAGNVAYEPASGLAYAAVRPPDQVVAFDPTSGTIAHRFRLTNCRGAHGLYLQPRTQHAFVACEDNAMLVTVDLQRFQQIGRATLGNNPDVLAYDPGLQRLYVAAESGTVTAFSTAGTRPHKLGQAHLADNAHTVAVDPTTHRVFFPLQQDPNKPGLRIMKPVGT